MAAFGFITVCVHRAQIETFVVVLVSMQLRRDLHASISATNLKGDQFKKQGAH